MNWYYAINQKRNGPVTEQEFQALAQAGTITADTLVWREGMPQWVRYAELQGGPGAPAGIPDGHMVCAVSGKVYPKSEMIEYEGKWVSAEHRDEFFQRIKEGLPVNQEALKLASFGVRFGAFLIDGVIQYLIGLGLNLLWIATIIKTKPDPRDAFAAMRYAGALGSLNMIVLLGYYLFFFLYFQATPGMLAVKIKLVRPDGTKVTAGRLVGRYFARYLSSLILGIGYLMAAWDPEVRTLHDRICDTRVIRK